jgi:uncharacterized membrane protein
MLILLKVLFALAATVFVGDIILMLVWKLGAERTREPKVLLFANKTVMLTDNLLLGPSAMLTAVSANLLAPRVGLNIYATPMLSIAMGAFILSGIVWSAFLIPTQKAQLKLCTELGVNESLPEKYFQLTAKWRTWGYLAAFLVVLALVLVALN